MNKEEHPQDLIQRITEQIEFMERMILAWNTDSVEIGEIERYGLHNMLAYIREEAERLKESI